jgi:hypothetical protein
MGRFTLRAWRDYLTSQGIRSRAFTLDLWRSVSGDRRFSVERFLELIASGQASSGGGTPYTGPLDIVPNPVAAFAMFSLSSEWTSDVVTLRRASDDTTQSFAPVAEHAVDPSAVASFMGATTYQCLSAGIVAGGSGYADGTFDVTVVGGTHSIAAVVNVSAESGAVNVVNSITTAGSYTALASNPAATTGGTGAGLTLNLQFGVLTGGAFATKWVNQRGNGNDVVQSTGANQPAWAPAHIGDMPGLSFDGVAQFLATAGDTDWTGSGFTVFVVVAPYAVSGTRQYALGVNAAGGSAAGPDINVGLSNANFDFSTDDAGYSNGAGGNFTLPTLDPNTLTLAVNSLQLFDAVIQPGSGSGKQNGVVMPGIVAGFGTGITGAVNLPLAIGALDAVTPGNYANGTIVAVIAYDTALSGANITAIRENIADKCGIVL